MPTASGRSEFDIIADLLAPLSEGEAGAFGLTDDAAAVDVPPGMQLVITKDALAVGVHVLPADPLDDVARKALRVNLSDLASMGAEPAGFLMALALSDGTTDAELETFIAGLADDVQAFAVPLIGGDIIRQPGPMMVSITAYGFVPAGGVLRRAGVSDGDFLYVSGTIGDGALGLECGKGDLSALTPEHREFLLDRYRRPQPRLALGQQLRKIASACIDVSDGLVADVTHMCEQSGVACRIDVAAVPVSTAASAAVSAEPDLMEKVLTGGDDYELAFAVPPGKVANLEAAAAKAGVKVTRVGRFSEGQGVTAVDPDGTTRTLSRSGYRHR